MGSSRGSRRSGVGRGVDFDDFKEHEDARQRSRFEKFQKAFNKEMKDKGDGRTLEDLMGSPPEDRPKPPTDGPLDVQRQLMEAAMEIHEATGENHKGIILRAVGLYRSIVRHWQAGGTVQFVDPDGNAKTLKSKVKA